jgi:hypothetical protein
VDVEADVEATLEVVVTPFDGCLVAVALDAPPCVAPLVAPTGRRWRFDFAMRTARSFCWGVQTALRPFEASVRGRRLVTAAPVSDILPSDASVVGK